MGWSLTNFNSGEIMEIAIQMEQSGQQFYEKALTIATDDKLKEMLVYLAQEEGNHIQKFTEIGEKLKQGFMPHETFAGEYEEYIKSLVNSHIFKLTEVEDLIKQVNNDNDILRFAISFEKDSIVFFQELKRFANQAASEILEELVNEEREHIKKIAAVFNSRQ